MVLGHGRNLGRSLVRSLGRGKGLGLGRGLGRGNGLGHEVQNGNGLGNGRGNGIGNENLLVHGWFFCLLATATTRLEFSPLVGDPGHLALVPTMEALPEKCCAVFSRTL